MIPVDPNITQPNLKHNYFAGILPALDEIRPAEYKN
jgi:hypothetical protein